MVNELSLVVESLNVTYKRRNYGQSSNGWRLIPEFEKVKALKDVSFSCVKGEITGVVGKNGAGKSTLFSSLAGQLSAKGTVRSASAPRLVRLDQRLPLSFTGRQHCDLIVGSILDDRKSVAAGVESAVEFAELGSAIDAPMKTYSKGMRSRLSFAALTVGQPEILLVDEALAVGDSFFLRKARSKIRALAQASTTVLLCDHSSARVSSMSDRCLLLEDGRLVADGPTSKIIEMYETN